MAQILQFAAAEPMDDDDPYETYRVKLRRGGKWKVKPYAENVDGLVRKFDFGWTIEHGIYDGEDAMLPMREAVGETWPRDAPPWIASGDLEPV